MVTSVTGLTPPSPGSPVLIDGAKGTELQRLGISVTEPWWTSAALLDLEGQRQLATIHQEYTAAGADLATAITFRTNRRTLLRAGADTYAAEVLVRRAVALARGSSRPGRAERRPVLAASVIPVEDCYQPSLVPSGDELREEHTWMARQLAAEGVELVVAETMNTVREAEAVVDSCTRNGLAVWVSFVCGTDGALLSGESVTVAARAVAAAGASLVSVNCTTLEGTDEVLARWSHDCPVPFGAYPNLEDRSGIADWAPVDRYVPVRHGPEEFADLMAERADRYGLSLVGGCCGSTPAHVAALRKRIPG
ncbi:homocysteine S-methyltransferase family protein [Streptomyces akebiae]|uniref:Homocysteine S-methyltransferase family protein n=1 Tax=Streptomyces akebiae TaxID=2865673 RepID=A0ABX8XVA5_9ACTN|nr:homocysteine S-methyltransferase family protein [Streptomyces akebiae]QYX79574.1 homocysteine S-methyltransferase family protein [Streptomyces akebiae]